MRIVEEKKKQNELSWYQLIWTEKDRWRDFLLLGTLSKWVNRNPKKQSHAARDTWTMSESKSAYDPSGSTFLAMALSLSQSLIRLSISESNWTWKSSSSMWLSLSIFPLENSQSLIPGSRFYYLAHSRSFKHDHPIGLPIYLTIHLHIYLSIYLSNSIYMYISGSLSIYHAFSGSSKSR